MNSISTMPMADCEVEGKRWRLMLCDDQRFVRLRLRQMLSETPSIQIVGEAADGQIAVSSALELRPDIILMDVSMPVLNGIEATRQIVSKLPETRVLAVSSDSSLDTVRQMMSAGASGFLLKPSEASELLLAIEKVLAGRAASGFPANV
jgi:two-component system, NarL family, nitrate/nitrite response regulator NarL